ncbi:cytochrome c biogenesis protein CcdA [Thermococcus sp. M39]|uniref:cytochrome c biogenesis protein CcdA n=1 Tax=unclassified Thermococcus TaxID=2627626 RepID=UPI00143C9F99|nr:cytochrome c biogenesis protein CcdA [Thermococcus sp. M39]NJE12290.1 cytochrome c biogenesis protein CcdA [Thermococcus sp. LS2]
MKDEIKALLLIIFISFGLTIVVLSLVHLQSMIFPLISLAVSDSINPCTFVIYTMFLIALSLKEGISKRRIYAIGLAFIVAIYISYYILGVGLVIFTKSIPTWIAGIVSIIFGGYTVITGYLEKSRVAGKKKVRKSIFRQEASILGAFALGVMVSFTLLPCSAGSYLIYAILISKIGRALTWILLGLYNIIFVLPLLIILFTVGSISESKSLSQKIVQRSRELSIIAGSALIVLGIYVLLFY